jgi:hypothetical protein
VSGLDAGQCSPAAAGVQCMDRQPPETAMQALKELVTSDVGLLSLGGIVFMLGMAVFFVRYFLRHMHEDEAKIRNR